MGNDHERGNPSRKHNADGSTPLNPSQATFRSRRIVRPHQNPDEHFNRAVEFRGIPIPNDPQATTDRLPILNPRTGEPHTAQPTLKEVVLPPTFAFSYETMLSERRRFHILELIVQVLKEKNPSMLPDGSYAFDEQIVRNMKGAPLYGIENFSVNNAARTVLGTALKENPNVTQLLMEMIGPKPTEAYEQVKTQLLAYAKRDASVKTPQAPTGIQATYLRYISADRKFAHALSLREDDPNRLMSLQSANTDIRLAQRDIAKQEQTQRTDVVDLTQQGMKTYISRHFNGYYGTWK